MLHNKEHIMVGKLSEIYSVEDGEVDEISHCFRIVFSGGLSYQ
jgi:hypothetical protein